MKTLQWVKDHVLPKGGIEAWHGYGKPYPEVSGYLIPTLLKYGCIREAEKLGDWLLKVQNKDGSWTGLDGNHAVFDTAAVVEGLDHLGENYAVDKGRSFIRSCMWANSYLGRYPGDEGRAQCYQARAAWVLGDRKAVGRWLPIGAWDAQWGDIQRTHYIAYLLEGLLNFGFYASTRMVLEASTLAIDASGFMPMHAQSGWLNAGSTDYCATAQFAWLYARVGMATEANRLGKALEGVIGDNGGIAQGKDDGRQISWAAKFYLDFLMEAQTSELVAG